MKKIMLCFTLLMLVFSSVSFAETKIFNDDAAMKGVQSGKLLFDMNHKHGPSIVLYLKVIKKTVNDIKSYGITPDVIIAFRGLSVEYIKTDYSDMTEREITVMKIIKKHLNDLMKMGVKMEACSIAIGLFDATENNILPGINIVNNTFLSLLGYHNQGYASIPIM